MVALPAQTWAGFDDLAGGDKVLHAGASLVVTDLAWAGAAALDAPLAARVGSGVGAAVVVGVGKEPVDALGAGDPSLGDLVYDGLGIAAGVGVALAVEALVAPRGGDDDDDYSAALSGSSFGLSSGASFASTTSGSFASTTSTASTTSAFAGRTRRLP